MFFPFADKERGAMRPEADTAIIVVTYGPVPDPFVLVLVADWEPEDVRI